MPEQHGVLCGRGRFFGAHAAGVLRLTLQEWPVSCEVHHLYTIPHRADEGRDGSRCSLPSLLPECSRLFSCILVSFPSNQSMC